ncbi:toll/interleukin-1 receptor domain-containing protein [Microbacterium sp. 179-B 1A2 NHS]|uniref:toll/interleukin-1 receptor domain-containing protein n=1 Tax=Microbacterium sp. 179-B 1A2 NHS TaxID=3142383 RepID=UPI0039A29740
MSYSWDSEEHINWVLQLATRLRVNGVDVVLDRWDTDLGSDLSLFMERAADTSYRIIAVATETYVKKADSAEGGVGYERKMVTPSLMADLRGNRVVPILRDNPAGRIPRFLGAARFVDFRDNPYVESAYFELLQDLHGVEPTPRPPLGRNPFLAIKHDDARQTVREDPARYVQPAFSERVVFNYDNNDGRYVIGAADRSFTISFHTAGYGAIHVTSDPSDIASIALAPHVSRPEEIGDAGSYDASSRVRTAHVGDAILLRNRNEHWAVVFVEEVYVRDTGPTGEPQVVFSYVIPAVRSSDFTDQ